MKTKVSLMVAISLFLFSCGKTSNEQKEKTLTHKGHHHDDQTENIALNNGEKWPVDSNMIVHIRNMENDINSFAQVENKDYKLIAVKLQSNIDLLTSNCTMEGKAHYELHKWLLPYIDLVSELSEAKNETEATNQFQKIQTSFTTFNQYFQ